MNTKFQWTGIVLALILATVALVGGNQSASSVSVGRSGTQFPNGITIGAASQNPTPLTMLQKGVCSLITGGATVAATSTVPMDCAITGVVSTDGVFAQFSTSTGWSIRGASASTTAGYITISVVNGTGGNSTVPASVANATKYIILR